MAVEIVVMEDRAQSNPSPAPVVSPKPPPPAPPPPAPPPPAPEPAPEVPEPTPTVEPKSTPEVPEPKPPPVPEAPAKPVSKPAPKPAPSVKKQAVPAQAPARPRSKPTPPPSGLQSLLKDLARQDAPPFSSGRPNAAAGTRPRRPNRRSGSASAGGMLEHSGGGERRDEHEGRHPYTASSGRRTSRTAARQGSGTHGTGSVFSRDRRERAARIARSALHAAETAFRPVRSVEGNNVQLRSQGSARTMKTMPRTMRFVLPILVGLTGASQAELSVDMTRGTVEPLPIAIPVFLGDTASDAEYGRKIADVVSGRSRAFRAVQTDRPPRLHPGGIGPRGATPVRGLASDQRTGACRRQRTDAGQPQVADRVPPVGRIRRNADDRSALHDRAAELAASGAYHR